MFRPLPQEREDGSGFSPQSYTSPGSLPSFVVPGITIFLGLKTLRFQSFPLFFIVRDRASGRSKIEVVRYVL